MTKKAMLIEEETGEFTEIPVEQVSKEWYRRPANYVLGQFDKDTEKNREKSLTIPDQSYTPREIIEKFTRGVPLDIVQEGSYDEIGDFDGTEPERALDITDVEEQLGNINKKIAAAKQSNVKGVVKGDLDSSPDITEESTATEASETK